MATSKAIQLSERQMNQIAKALADPRRYQILKMIASKECEGCAAMREKVSISPATLSHHIKELESAGLIAIEREGKYVNVTFCRDVWQAYLEHLAHL